MNKLTIVIIITVLVIVLGFLGNKKTNAPVTDNTANNETKIENDAQQPPIQPENSNNNVSKPEKGLLITSPKLDETVTSPLLITGQVSGDGWAGFEAQAGTVQLQDKQGNILATGILTMPGDWMQLPADFESTLRFNVPAKQTATLVFRNENASDLPQNNREFRMDIMLAPNIQTSTEKKTIKVFFNKTSAGSSFECENVAAIERRIDATASPARSALQELLQGPTANEKSEGYMTSINEGVRLQKLTIENGVAKADFSQELEKAVGGSCRVAAIRAQITQTLKQFPSIKQVVISINDRTDDILQP